MANNKLYTFSELLNSGIVEDTDDGTQKTTLLDRIFVPTIQRPYAQGRPSAKDIRENFIRDIFKALHSPQIPFELNFVFGSLIKDKSGNSFELLDGQQRLTTLLLLHWFMLMKEKEIDPSKLSSFAKFSYKTRTTSIQFLEKLFKAPIPLDDSPSICIMKQTWYTSHFSKDSTVSGMLNTLDAIDARYKEERLNNQNPKLSDLECLKFYLQELKDFGITDDLFIKMNARGLQLTPFENFKAELIGWMKSNPFNDNRYEDIVEYGDFEMPFWLAVSSKFDTIWPDIFWKPSQVEDPNNLGAPKSDAAFFRFIKRWLANKALTLSVKTEDSEFEAFYDKFDDKNLNKYSSFDNFRNFFEKAHLFGIDILKELTHFLDSFILHSDTIQKSFCAPWQKIDKCQKPMDEKFEMRPMIIFSAISEFVGHDTAKFDSLEFERWMRLVHNVVQNQDINQTSRQQTLTKQLKRAIEFNDKPIYERFKEFNQTQRNREFNAESLKIERILNNSNWEEAFKNAEKDPFMTGSVNFYLSEDTDIETFKKRTDNVKLIFNENGVIQDFAKDYLLIRSIFALDTNLFDPDRNYINFTNKEAANRYLKNMTIWNANNEIHSFWIKILDMKSPSDMISELKNIVRNPSKINISNTSQRALENLNEGLKRFCAEDTVYPIEWLQETIKDDNRQLRYNKDTGILSFIKGPVNCMYLNNYREEFIPSFINELENNGWSFQYWDSRQPASLNKYKLYTGERIWIKAQNHLNNVIFRFDPNFKFFIYFNAEEASSIIEQINKEELPSGISFTSLDFQEMETWDKEIYIRMLDGNDIRDIEPKILVNFLSGLNTPLLNKAL